MKNKVYPRSKLKTELNRQPDQQVVFTNGCFDLLHIGHVRYLRAAREYGDLLVVGVNSDSSVRELKGKKRPLISAAERAELLANLEMVDYVTIFSELTAEKTITCLQPDVYVKGGDYTVEELPEAEAVQDYGGRIELVPEIKGTSTTKIIDKIKKRYTLND